MNKDIKASMRFKTIANNFLFAFVILTLTLPPLFSYLFDNYWLLFGIIFSLLGYIVKDLKPEKFFFLVTVAIVIYWFNVGFHFTDLVTFFWLSYLFGSVAKAFVIEYEDLSEKIIDNMASEMTSKLINGEMKPSDVTSEIVSTIRNQNKEKS